MLHPCPLNEQGFIDEKKMFQLVVGTLKLPIAYLDELSPVEIGWLLENHFEERMEHYELVSTAFAYGYASAKKGKRIPLFKKNEKEKVKKITNEQREREIKYLESVFGKEGESN